MAEEQSSSSQSPSFNLNSVLALLTLAGGLWLVSHKLTSSRPVTAAGGTQPFIGEQTLEARLWEDPFKTDEHPQMLNGGGDTNSDLGFLVEQIRERSAESNKVLLLPVMLGGGHYGEDQESRIRSRFAIVSALARSGYAPEDAEHLGALRVRWPTRHQVDQAKDYYSPDEPTNLWVKGTNFVWLSGRTNSSPFANMDLRYEWYRHEDTILQAQTNSWTSVLVLWLDDSFFEDEPWLRLAVLLEPLSQPATNGLSAVPINLIGPRRSATLHAMLGGFSGTVKHTLLWPLEQNILTNISVYCATPSAMDEVLVPAEADAPMNAPPRTSMSKLFVTMKLKSFHNFAATDDQLAREAFEELALNHIDLREPDQHVILLTEWDTFYARALTFTYAAELGQFQDTNASLRQLFDKYAAGFDKYTNGMMPTNFHSFFYLRGLDGQTVSGDGTGENNRGKDDRAGGSLTGSFEEFRNWVPDANKAEGRAQFDYLNRLGDQISELAVRLHRADRGEIKAIGIVGSDVYDTLLILQALRDRFPDVKFFTTDLDARFCQPRERKWARDLLVMSGYGLALHPRLQGEVAAFRDSTQTAQFAAALAALGNRQLADLKFVPPRRFQIGTGAIADLSVSNAVLPMWSGKSNPTNGPWLHPLTLSEKYQFFWKHIWKHSIYAVLCGLLLLLGACVFYPPLRRFTLDAFSFPCLALAYSEEDVGGPEGADVLLTQLQARTEQRFIPMIEGLPSHSSPPASPPEADGVRELVWLLNRLSDEERSLSECESDEDKRTMQTGWNKCCPPVLPFAFWRRMRSLNKRFSRRCWLDKRLNELTDSVDSWGKPAAEPGRGALRAAKTARKATLEIFRLRCERLFLFWCGVIGFGVFALGLGYGIWYDTLVHSIGEPFSLTNGVSEWPAEILRLAICFAAVSFGFDAYRRLRETFFGLTREFRFSPPEPGKIAETRTERPAPGRLRTLWRAATLFIQPLPPQESAKGVCALRIWSDYRQHGRLSRRFVRIALLMIFYVGLCWITFRVFDADPFDDVRGPIALRFNHVLVMASGLLFVALAFFTIDATLLCRRFIQELSAGTTIYSEATYRHFSRSLGEVQAEYLDEWIDLQMIAEVTERVGRLVYYPCWLLLALVLARNGWWDTLSWPTALILVFALNLVLALASAIMLQRAAKDAKRKAERTLEEKVRLLEARTAASVEKNQADQAAKLLAQIRDMKRGAFVLFWQNPIVGALTVSSGSMTLIQMVIWLMGR